MQLTTRNPSATGVHPTTGDEAGNLVPTQDSFQWISSEGLLRDEGALFGIAAADITDKLNAIASYFKSRSAAALQKKQYLDQKIQEIDLVLSVSKKELEKIKAGSADGKLPANNLLPVFFQLVAIVSVCFFNYFLVKWWLAPAIQSDIICIGIYLFGLFSVYISRGLARQFSEESSTVESTVEKQKWKFFAREFSVSAAIALFICTLSFRYYPTQYTIAAFLVLFILFLTGKVLINSLYTFRAEAGSWLSFQATKLRSRRQQNRLQKGIEKSEAYLDKTRLELIEPATILKKLEAEQEYKTRVFLSEYNLALQSRPVTGKPQAKQFV